MPLFDSENDGSSSSSDEEANAAMRAEIARKNKEEREKMIKRRREAEAREEEQRFKLEKISDLTLQEVLERKALLIGPEDKNDFKTFIPKVVAHFQKEEKDESFNQRMREITSIIGLTNFIVERHSALLSEPAGDVEAFLKKFQKEIVESLGEMTKILPKEEYLKLATLGNVFVDSREKLMKKEAMKRNMDDFMERARLVRIQEEQEEELAMDELTNIFAQTNISFDASVTREMANISLHTIRNPRRHTSPPRNPFSASAMEQMIAQFAHLLVDKETRTGQKQQQPVDLSVVKTEITEEEEEEEMEQGEMSFADMMNLSKPVEGEAEKTLDKQNPQASNTIHGDMDRQEKEEDVGGESDLELELELQSDDDDEYSEAEEIDQQEVEDFIPNWRQVLEYEDRIPMNFGRHPTEEYTKEWRASRFEDKHRKARMAQNKEANVVKFAPFGSSLNRMRIFEKPNGHFFHCGDDGPITNYVDLSLKNGWKTLLRTNSGPPLVVHKTPLEGFGRQLTNHCQRITTPVQPYMKGYHGNIFGRFWFPRDPEYDKTLESSSREPNYDDDDEENFIYYPEDDDEHSSRRDNGFLRQYTQRELHLLYSSKLNEIHQQMRRGTVRKLERADVKGGGGVSGGEVASVLLLTDWRLAHFSTNPVVLTNAIVQFMPTNLGDVFFKTMAEYLTELLLDANIEICTIIFAFGGSPRFKKEDFLRFWKKLTVQTMQRVDVIWTAQDWWDGLRPTLEQQQELAEFNDYVKRMFEAMRRSGYRNYKFWNIRERLEAQGKKFETPVVARVPDTQLLEPIYSAYLKFFLDQCNCYAFSYYFLPALRHYDRYKEDQCQRPCRGNEFLPYKP